jgi:tetratricopeptide (TPR) repeat protein
VNRLLRLAACAIIAATAVWTISHLYGVYRCNIEARRAEREVIHLFSVNNEITARIVARRTLDSMNGCIACVRTDVNQYMIRAAALRMLERPAEAATDYRRALRFDRRAELYLNLGQAELEAGRPDAAEDAFITAIYLTYSYIEDLPEPLQSRVRSAVTPTYLSVQEGRAPASVAEELRQRVARDPR